MNSSADFQQRRMRDHDGIILISKARAKKVIALAKRGSVSDLLLLGNHFSMISQSLADETLSALLEFTGSRRLPDTKPPSRSWAKDEIENIEIAMSTMSALAASHRHFNPPINPPVLESLSLTLSSHFSHVLPWLRLFFDNAGDIAPIAYGSPTTSQFLSRVLDAFGIFSRCDMCAPFLIALESIDLVTKFWFTATGKAAIAASRLLLQFFETASTGWMTLFHGHLCSDAEKTARIAMHRLQSALQAKPVDFENMVFNDVAHHLAGYFVSLRQPLANKGFVSATSKAAHLILDSDASTNYICDSLVKYIGVMPLIMHSTDRFVCLFEGVRSGLFDIINRTILSFDLPEDYSKEFHSTLVYMSRYLEVYSFIGIAAEAMRSLQSEGWDSCKKNKDLFSDWKVFIDLVVSRAIMKSKYDRWLMRKKSHCDNCDREFDGLMKMCAGCKDTYYCSKACQTMSWREGDHRENCENKFLRPQYTNEWGRIKRRDWEFTHIIATMDIRRHIPALLTLEAKMFSDTPPSLLGFAINYSIFPPVVEVFRVVDLFVAAGMRPGIISGIISEEVLKWDKTENIEGARRRTGNYIAITLPDMDNKNDETGSSAFVQPKFIDGMDWHVPFLGRDASTSAKRVLWRDGKGRSLEAEYDEVDEMVRQMQPLSWNSLWDKIDGSWDAPDWPFKVPAP
ncbi:hypothetical protein DFH11DRAFT_1728276 [Phellopilus nigrolimitatus]|nr:hypothetical protein DFH11DRAFT_1728276 [Phellopilus nigrolimitatus]